MRQLIYVIDVIDYNRLIIAALSNSFLQLFSPHIELWLLLSTTAGVAYLPPVGVLLVHHLQDVSFGEVQAGIFTGDQAVCFWIIVEVWLQVNLRVAIEMKNNDE